MFSAPSRQSNEKGEQVFEVKVNLPPLGVRLRVTATEGLVYDNAAQTKINELQQTVLSELCKHTQLFKTAPTLAYLQTITPKWGFIVVDGVSKISPYTIVNAGDIGSSKVPCIVDLQLERLRVSRSLIQPVFHAVFVQSEANIIDFDWEPASELEEVSDVPSSDSEVITLADPAVRAREKAEAKAQVRAAFLAAEEARIRAESLAEAFEEKFDLSDSESAFSEWLTDDDQ